MKKPSKETVETIEGAIKEILANCVLLPKDDEDRAWNTGRMNAIETLRRYQKGDGLFQME